jgi:hypothetical protein
MNLTPKFLYSGISVTEVYDFGDFLVPVNVLIKKRKNSILFNNKFDAMYKMLLYNLEKGKKIENYKSSKYYKKYIERLKIENPEYLI